MNEFETHHKSIGADSLIEKTSDNGKLQGSAPEIVEEYDRLVEPARGNIQTKITSFGNTC